MQFVTDTYVPTKNRSAGTLASLLLYLQGLDPDVFSRLFVHCTRCDVIILSHEFAGNRHRCTVGLVQAPRFERLRHFFLTDVHPGATIEEFQALFVRCSRCQWVVVPGQMSYHVCHDAVVVRDDWGLSAPVSA